MCRFRFYDSMSVLDQIDMGGQIALYRSMPSSWSVEALSAIEIEEFVLTPWLTSQDRASVFCHQHHHKNIARIANVQVTLLLSVTIPQCQELLNFPGIVNCVTKSIRDG